MSLAEHIRLRTPLIWNKTDEPERVIDFVANFSDRDVYRIDPFKGLSHFVEDRWKVCIVEIFDPDQQCMVEQPTWNVGISLQYVMEHRGIFIMPNAHLKAEELLDFFSGIYWHYRDAYSVDDLAKVPMQLIMLSCTDKIPPEIARHVANISYALPTVEELGEMIAHIEQNSESSVLEEKVNLARLTRSGLGLAESEFMQGCLLSLRESQKITADFIDKFKRDKIKQGGILEIRRPKLTLDDIGGLDQAKELIQSVVWAWDHPEEAAEFGIVPLRRILLLGVPGAGKSAICEAIAKTFDFDMAKFGVSGMMNKYIGESEANMRFAFAQVNAMQPVVCWMDELGRDLSGSGNTNDSGTTDRVHGEFLTGLQELGESVFLVAAANRVDGLPPEMLRADRFDKVLFVGFPTEEERIEIFRIHLGTDAMNHNLEELAAATTSFTGAEIKALVRETRFKISTAQKRHITTEDLISLVPMQKNRVWLKHKGHVLSMYEKAVSEFEWASSGQQAEAQSVLTGKIGTKTAKSAQFQAF